MKASGDLIAIDYKDNIENSSPSWSIFKGNWKRSGVYIASDSVPGSCDNPVQGDVNCDSIINVIDIITIMNMILGSDLSNFSDYEIWSADLSNDNNIDIFDIITIVNLVLEN